MGDCARVYEFAQKYVTLDKKLADKYKSGKGSSRRSSASTTATAAPTTAREVATATLTAGSSTATPTADSASNRIFAETIANDLVDFLISQSLSSYEGVRSALMYLYKRDGVVPTQYLKSKMAQYIAGCKRTIQTEKQDRGKKQRMKLCSVIKSLMAKVTSEEPNKKYGSPINLEVGDDGITWAIVQEFMSSLKNM